MNGRAERARSGAVVGWGRALVVLVLVTVVAGLPLVWGRVLAGHDIVVYLINAQQMAENMRSGELFPAWGGGFNAGYGAPTLLFFPPLTSYIHAIPVVVGVPVILGASIWSLVGLLLSGVAVYGWLRSAGLAAGALQGAVVYMAAPYRFIDLYHRSALAEHWAFIWPPLILWVAASSRLPPLVRSALTAGSVAMLLVSNIPLATLFGIGLGVWFVVSRDLRGRRLSVASGAVLGFAAAAFALVPQSMSSSLLAVDRYYGAEAGRFRPSANGLFSGGLETWDFNAFVSLSLVVVFALAVLAFAALAPEARRRNLARAAIIGSAVCLVAASTPAAMVWDELPVLSRFQFPWRIAALMTFGVAVLTGLQASRRAWGLAALVMIASVPFAGWDRTAAFETFFTAEPDRVAPGTVFPDPHRAWEAGSGGWYWRHHNLAEIWFAAANARPFLLAELAGNRASQLDRIRGRPGVLVEHPTTPVRVLAWASTRRALEVRAARAGPFMWRSVAFPEMPVTIDGEPTPTSVDQATGLLVHQVPAGVHRVEWSWTPFPALRWARRVSLVAVAAMLGLLALGHRFRDRGNDTSAGEIGALDHRSR